MSAVALDEAQHRGAYPIFRKTAHREQPLFQGSQLLLKMMCRSISRTVPVM